MPVMHMKQWELVSTDVVLRLFLPLTNTVTSEKNFELSKFLLSAENMWTIHSFLGRFSEGVQGLLK